MKDTSGKNIDDIFREKLLDGERYVEYHEADWDALESKLDARPKPIVPWIRIFSAAAAILLVVIFSWMILRPRGQDQSITKNEQVRPVNPQPHESENNSSSELSGSSNSPGSKQPLKPSITVSTNKKRAAIPHLSKEKETKITIEKNEPENIPLFAETSTPSILAGSIHKNQQTLVEPVRLGTFSENGSIVNKTRQGKNWNGWAIGIIASTDLNGVGSFQHSSVGGDFGFTVTARITDKWSISTGAIYAKKPYTIAYDQYRPGSKYQPSVQPDKVHADCRVLDIPVTISYTFLKRKNDSFSLGTGISSYLMLREDYYFQYANSYNQGFNELSIVNRNRHWFGVVNLQASYERQIRTGLSIGFGPYLKLPVDDIGYGRVKLQSAGLAVTVNWHLSH